MYIANMSAILKYIVENMHYLETYEYYLHIYTTINLESKGF
jgi:hypothetical protein